MDEKSFVKKKGKLISSIENGSHNWNLNTKLCQYLIDNGYIP